MSERKITYDFLLGLANHHGLILERENVTMDGIKYRYSVTSNLKGTEALCSNLIEVHQEIMALK